MTDDVEEKNKTEEKILNPWKESDYLEKWNANAYLTSFCQQINGQWLPVMYPLVSNINELLQTKLNKKEQIVLEFGGGPCLWGSLLLAEYFDQIWFCDFAPSNLKSIQDWLDEKPDAFNWKPFFNYVLDIKQGHHHNEFEYETKLRSALRNRKIFRCDVNKINSLFIDSPNDQQKFQMIFSSFCLESACSSYNILKQTILRFSDLLESGGMLLICSFKNSTSYTFNGDTFTDLPLSPDIIRNAFLETGHLTEPTCISLDSQPNPTYGITNHGIMINYGFKI
ncbi:unnamed protein product [Rotaria sp. Silwood2]|nr:unnamed protein product [Rotaria sp. Silwood2]CAF3234686.1 unnamed protein product [Rotaria sp. Silwood2]CAF3956796.1 unnamed protein product [Rotaria sp. Silwood2]